jgi:hypothetical protein
MRTVSIEDYSRYYLLKRSRTSAQKTFDEVILQINNPYVVKKAVKEWLEKLRKDGKSAKQIAVLRKKYSRMLAKLRNLKRIAERKEEEAKKKRAEQFRLHDLAYGCILFVDANLNSKILDKGSTAFSSWLHMSYSDKGIAIIFRYSLSGYSNGHQWVRVKIKNKVVLEIDGPAMGIEGQKVIKYIPGKWEKQFKLKEE